MSVQHIDPITLEFIPSDRLINFTQLNVQYHFDINTLYQNHLNTNKYMNPFNRQPLPNDVIDKIKEYSNSLKIIIPIKTLFKTEENLSITVDKNEKLGNVLLTIYRDIHLFGGLENLSMFRCLVLYNDEHQHSLCSVDLNTTLSNDVKYIIMVTLFSNPHSTIGLYEKLYKFAVDNHIEHVKNFIPQQYKTGIKPTDNHITDEQFMMLKSLVSEFSIENKFKYFINNRKIRLSSKQARQLCKFICDFKTGYLLEHLIFSLVTDKFNLKRQGVEGYYIKSQYDLPVYNKLNIPGDHPDFEIIKSYMT